MSSAHRYQAKELVRSNRDGRVILILMVILLAVGPAVADGPAQRPGFEEGHGYSHGPTDSLELRTLNPIVSQALSPAYPILDDFKLQITAHHMGFMWDTYPDVNGVARSAFYGTGDRGIVGSGWYLNPGRIWYDIYQPTGESCNRLRYAYVDSHDAILGLDEAEKTWGGRYEFDFDPNLPGTFNPNYSPMVANACTMGSVYYIWEGFDYGKGLGLIRFHGQFDHATFLFLS